MRTFARHQDRAELLARLERVRPDSLARWGRMSAPQMVCHLGDAFLMMIGEKSVSDATGLAQRTLIKWIVLYAPFRWPPGILTRPEIDQTVGGTTPGDFRRDVARVGVLVARVIGASGRAWPPHPIFGPMSEAAWMRWAYLHMDHHLRQFGA